MRLPVSTPGTVQIKHRLLSEDIAYNILRRFGFPERLFCVLRINYLSQKSGANRRSALEAMTDKSNNATRLMSCNNIIVLALCSSA